MRINQLLKFKDMFSNTIRRYAVSEEPQLTQILFNIQRGNYATLNDQDVSIFESIISSQYIQRDNLQGYNADFLRTVIGNSQLVLKPKSTEELSAIMKYCNERKLAVCPQGGNTGLVGGAVPICDEIIISLQRMNKILRIDEITGIVACESGCILENLDKCVRDAGLIIPLDLGSKQSCFIGGNVSTNAGGLRVVRYGNLHGSILGMEAVLPNGDILNLMSDFKKDNTGYHLKHLFIGSEGTLGIITKLTILCPPAPKSIHVAFLGLNTFDNVLKTFTNARLYLGETLSACELIDEAAFECGLERFNFNTPIKGYPFYMLIETSGSNSEHDLEKFHQFLNNGMNSNQIQDGTITNEIGKMQEIWKIRELVVMALLGQGYCFKYDLSLPLRQFYDIVYVMRNRCGNMATTVSGLGHLGDSNLHLNITCPEYSDELLKIIEPYVFEYTTQLKGSISAEHGIGFLKRDFLKYGKSTQTINMMSDIKKLLDPNNILNPYKIVNY